MFFLKMPLKAKRLLLSFALLTTVGCQAVPTRMLEKSEGHQGQALAKIKPLQTGEIDWNTVVIVDTRPLFKYQLAQVPRSFHFAAADWELFSYTGAALLKKTSQLQRRLALKGISPFTPVVIFGSGQDGRGEEHYAAALLSALGVRTLSISKPVRFSRALMARKRVVPLGNAPYWTEPLKHNISCSKGNSKNPIGTPGSFWAYEKAMTSLKNNKPACVQVEDMPL